jgi:N-acetylglutamate synthase-like GNAT family acetyltransferase
VSDPRLDALAGAARNRGLKLVRSRVRTPGKRRFGKVGLTDASGKPAFGMDAKGPVATPDAVEDYLRTLEAKDWGASLNTAGRKRNAPERAGGGAAEPERAISARASPPPLTPKPQPKPQIRDAKPSDAPRLAELIRYLGHQIDEKAVRENLSALKKTGDIPLVATLEKTVVGLCGVRKQIVISRPAPLGRITSLVVAEDAQGHGIGRMLVQAAEAWMEKAGCQMVEVTSNDRRAEAHAFYRHMGYERTSIRFAKAL